MTSSPPILRPRPNGMLITKCPQFLLAGACLAYILGPVVGAEPPLTQATASAKAMAGEWKWGRVELAVAADAVKPPLRMPFGVDFLSDGVPVMVEFTGGRVFKLVNGPQALRPIWIAGTGGEGDSGDDGPALEAVFHGMHGLAIQGDDRIFLADTLNNRIRRLDVQRGTVHAFAGTGKPGFSGDGGPARDAVFHGVFAAALDPTKTTLVLADLSNRRVRTINLKTGEVTTRAGNGRNGVPADGSDAQSSPLVDPRAVAADAQGTIYILERGGHALRAVDAAGRIRTLVGTGRPGNGGDDGPATRAQLRGPKHLCVDLDGAVLIADTDNHRIRRYDPSTGVIRHAVGQRNGQSGHAGIGGPPDHVGLNQPHGIAVHPSGDVYIADSANNRVLKIPRKRS